MIDYVALQQALRTLKPRHKLFKLLKSELQLQGYWKNKDRGVQPPQSRPAAKLTVVWAF